MRLPRFFANRRRPVPAPFAAPLAPDASMAVVGDIHGCDRLLETLLGKIAKRAPDIIVFVGDYVDRGEHSAGVLNRLFDLHQSAPEKHKFLRGNHEEMMLRFLDAPEDNAARWARYGGLQTLASYQIGGLGQHPGPQQAIRVRDALARAIGADVLAWIRAMPLYLTNGNVAIAHAGANPAKPLSQQSEQALLWGHRDFPNVTRTDGTWVVYGHTIVADIAPNGGRIGVDTGAYATGRLSAALIDDTHLETLTATRSDA